MNTVETTSVSPHSSNAMLPAVALVECCRCGNQIEEDYYREKDNEIYCDNCHEEQFQFHCPVCEEYHDKTGTPEKTFFYLHEQHGNLKPGYYRVKEFPVFISDMFSAWICESAVELVSENICYKHEGKLQATEFICEDCFNDKGLSQWRVENHIRHAMREAYKPRKYKDYKKVVVSVSPEYFEIMGGKIRFKNVKLKKDKSKKVQQLSVNFELEEGSKP